MGIITSKAANARITELTEEFNAKKENSGKTIKANPKFADSVETHYQGATAVATNALANTVANGEIYSGITTKGNSTFIGKLNKDIENGEVELFKKENLESGNAPTKPKDFQR